MLTRSVTKLTRKRVAEARIFSAVAAASPATLAPERTISSLKAPQTARMR
jgi:hypothetical protein